jgi:hypothetical protein
MKNLLLSLFSLSVFLIACNTASSPEDVAKNYVKALNENKFKDAMQYGDPETDSLLMMMQSLNSMPGADKNNQVLEFVKSEISDTTAVVYFKDKKTANEVKVPVKKINGKWLVAQRKEGLMGGDMNANPMTDSSAMKMDTSAMKVDSSKAAN